MMFASSSVLPLFLDTIPGIDPGPYDPGSLPGDDPGSDPLPDPDPVEPGIGSPGIDPGYPDPGFPGNPSPVFT